MNNIENPQNLTRSPTIHEINDMAGVKDRAVRIVLALAVLGGLTLACGEPDYTSEDIPPTGLDTPVPIEIYEPPTPTPTPTS